MGEQKRREAIRSEYEKLIDDLTREFTNRGKIIEVGWLGLRMAWLHPDTPENQIKELRMAFFAGALHLYSSMMASLDPGDDETPGDLQRMRNIDTELRAFEMELKTNGPITKARQ
jgi:hypothetical protein